MWIKHWMDHIDAVDDLRQGVSLRAYSNRDPVVEYRFESAEMFDEMINAIKQDTVKQVLTVRIIRNQDIKRKQIAKISGESSSEAMAASSEKRRP